MKREGRVEEAIAKDHEYLPVRNQAVLHPSLGVTTWGTTGFKGDCCFFQTGWLPGTFFTPWSHVSLTVWRWSSSGCICLSTTPSLNNEEGDCSDYFRPQHAPSCKNRSANVPSMKQGLSTVFIFIDSIFCFPKMKYVLSYQVCSDWV